jgi:hypothetical protein
LASSGFFDHRHAYAEVQQWMQIKYGQEVRSKLGAMLEVPEDSIHIAMSPKTDKISPVLTRTANNAPSLITTDSYEVSAIVAPPVSVGCVNPSSLAWDVTLQCNMSFRKCQAMYAALFTGTSTFSKTQFCALGAGRRPGKVAAILGGHSAPRPGQHADAEVGGCGARLQHPAHHLRRPDWHLRQWRLRGLPRCPCLAH